MSIELFENVISEPSVRLKAIQRLDCITIQAVSRWGYSIPGGVLLTITPKGIKIHRDYSGGGIELDDAKRARVIYDCPAFTYP